LNSLKNKPAATFLQFLAILLFSSSLFLPIQSIAKISKNEKAINRETHWFALFISGKKSGYMQNERIELSEYIKHRNTLYMEINRSGTIISSIQIDETLETKDGKPISFKKTEEVMGNVQSVEGNFLPGGTLKIKIINAGRVLEKESTWPKGVLLNEGVRLLKLQKGLHEGTEFSLNEFSLNALKPLKVNIKVGKSVPVQLLKGKSNLIEITDTIGMESAAVDIKTYVDSSYAIKKIEFKLIGSEMQFFSCSKDYALSPNEKNDLMASTMVSSPIKLKNSDMNKKIKYKFKINSNFQLENIPGSAEQKIIQIDKKENSITLSVEKIKSLAGGSCVYTGKDKQILEALQPSIYVQSDDKEIKKLAKK
jgi:hypothetical protein